MDNEIVSHIMFRDLLNNITRYFNIPSIEYRERVFRFNSRLSIYVNNEETAKHHRPHAHITVNNNRIGRIFLDTFEIDDDIERRDKTQINAWLKTNKQNLLDAWKRNNGKIDIPFSTM